MRILISGSRTWDDVETIYAALDAVWEEFGRPPYVELIHGNDPSGADMICDQYAVEHGWSIRTFPPNWSRDGKQAYRIRNEDMVDYGADIGLVFFTRRSSRPEQMIKDMELNEIPYRTYWE